MTVKTSPAFATLLALTIGASTLVAPPAHAQDYDDLDSDEPKKQKKTRERKQQEVREIVKGFYAKSSVGGAFYLLDFAGFVYPGTALGLAVGQDFVNQERRSMAWEIGFSQGIHNGCHFDIQAGYAAGGDGCRAAAGTPPPYVQGDLRTYTFSALLEASIYPNRRFGLGLRLGGGVLTSPLLMHPDYYQEEVVQKAWGIPDPGYHGAIHPLGMGGLTFEYYTKLSHFSVGLDADAAYVVNFDLGASVTGNLKYTF